MAAPPEAVAYLSAQLIKRMEGAASRFEMQLHPADLGRVDVRLHITQDGRLNAQLAFDNPLAATDFRAQADTLRRSLEQAGFTLSDGSLSFTDRGAQGHSDHGGSGRGSARIPTLATSPAGDTDPVAPTVRAMRGLDLRV